MKFLVILPLVLITILFSNVYAQTQTDLDNGRSAMRNGDYEEAINYFEKVLEDDPNNVIALINKAGSLIQIQQPLESLEYLDKALMIDPKNALAYNNKGLALMLMGNFPDALKNFEKAAEIDPNYVLAKKYISLLKEQPTYAPINGFLEVAVYEKDNQLIAYLKTNNLQKLDNSLVDDYLNSWETKKVMINGEKHIVSILRVEETTKNQNSLHGYRGHYIGNEFKLLALKFSYPFMEISAGDKIILQYTVFTPLE